MKTKSDDTMVTREDESHSGVTEQERLDEAMAESFPASDPPSWTAGLKHEEDELTEDSREG